MHNAIAHQLPTNAQLVLEQWSPQANSPPVYILDMTSHGMEYPFGQFGSAALAVSPPSFLCPSSLLAGWAWEAEKSLTWYKHCLATSENLCVLSTFFSYWTQNITLCQLLERKLTLSQPKPGHKHMYKQCLLSQFYSDTIELKGFLSRRTWTILMSTVKFYRTTSSLETLLIFTLVINFTSQANTGTGSLLNESLLELKHTLQEVE